MIVGVIYNCLPTFDSSPKVKFDNVACPFLVKKHRPVVYHKSCAVDPMGEFVRRGLSGVLKVVE